MASIPVRVITATDRQLPPAPDPLAVVGQLRQRMGTWRSGGSTVVADRDCGPIPGGDDVGYYGGFLVCESVPREYAIAIARLPELLDIAPFSVRGREILAAIAEDLDTLPLDRYSPVSDGFDACQRVARLARDLRAGGLYQLAERVSAIAPDALTARRGIEP